MTLSASRRSGRSLAIVLVALAVLGAYLAASAPATRAQPPNYVAGNACGGSLTPRWQSGDTWIMYANVTVPLGCILTIEPGAIVKGDQAARLYINGQLQANGTAASPISFDANVTGEIWGGVQFNKTSRVSYLQQATLRNADAAVRGVQNPIFAGPTIQFNTIDRCAIGILLQGSNAVVWGNRVNNTLMGIQMSQGGSPIIAVNAVTTVSGNPAIGIYATNLDTPDITTNTVRWINGTAGADGAAAGQRGQDGGSALGIFVNGTTNPIVAGNTVDAVRGGKGGLGAAAIVGNGGAGGAGGGAAGIVLAFSGTSRVQNGGVTNIFGGHGGDGGAGSGLGATSGAGGAGGTAVAYENFNDTAQAWWFYNTAATVVGGSAGNSVAGSGGASTGRGGTGGDGNGFFFVESYVTNASNDGASTVRGGYGGNGSAGGAGGQAAGLWVLGVGRSATLGNNTVSGLTGGQGGSGTQVGGTGGNASGILAFDTGLFNSTLVANNQVTSVTGGAGGLCLVTGGLGGGANGIGAYHVKLTTLSNRIQTITGGQSGPSAPSNAMGQAGTAAAIAAVFVPGGVLSADRIQSVTRGSPASAGLPAPPAYGVGFLSFGSPADRASALLTNTTFTSVGNFDLYLDNYTATTTLNVSVSSARVVVMAAANLTVRNFLAVKAFWPNNTTLVSRVTVTVTDNSATTFSRVIPSGSVQWIAVTNRVYINRPVPTWNATQASVAFGSYTFANDPRAANLTASQTQYFTMIDAAAPTSSASALPTWTGTLSFSVHFTYSDGNGTGVSNVTLWSNRNGTGWIQSGIALVSSSGSGAFPFTAPGDGTYQFATTAWDKAGNHQAFPPTANNTWTIVDTTIPTSAVVALPTWERSLSFTVSWAPASGETDVAFYTIEYQHGGPWVTWLADTTLRSSTFNISALGLASPQGVYAFHSIAHTFAGLEESKTANDTWTIVDTIPPSSAVASLPRYETAPSFSVTWAAAGGTLDVANYTLQVSADGGAWTTWFSGATNASATFTGRDGHRYAFRSLAMDFAGNLETKTTNDTWTVVDTTAPTTSVSALPRFETAPSFGVYWAPKVGTTDTVSYAVQVSTDGAAWVTWFTGATNLSATFTGRDGHAYAFRSLGTDAAGNVETKSANDTWTVIDTTPPFVVSDAPEGSGVGTAPAITITFSEPMDEASVVQAFSMTPAMNGNFTWNTAGTVLTFTPARPLVPGTAYGVTISTAAKDLAGNAMTAPKTFVFTTVGAASIGGLDPLWLLLAVVAAAGVAAGIFLLRRRSAPEETAAEAPRPVPAAAAPQAEIDDVFLLYKDGILVKHETLRLRPDIDTDILSGMLTAVQQFVKDSFQSEDEGELNEITVGQMHLHIGRGKWLILAARVAGGDVATMNEQIRKALQDMEDHHWDQLEDWDGDMGLAKVLGPYLKKLIRGDYA